MNMSTKLQPLLEDLGRVLSGDFLISTEYKRWMVERDLDELWGNCLQYVRDNRKYFMVGFNHDAHDAKEAFDVMLNFIFEQNKELLPAFILDLLLLLMR